MLELAHAVGRIDVDQDQPRLRGRKLRDRPLRAVRGPDSHPIARFETQAQQAGGERVGARLELRIGPAHALVGDHQRESRAVAPGDLVEAGSDRLLDQGRRAVAPHVALLRHGVHSYLPSNVISGGSTLSSKALAVLMNPRCTSWVLKSSIVMSGITASAAAMPPPDQAFSSVRVAA